MAIVSQIVFALLLGVAVWIFARKIRFIRRNILLGRDIKLNDRKAERWKMMSLVALGQSKMVVRPIAGFLHILVYAGFVLINIEILEIIIDGLAGTHRIFMEPLGSLYTVAISFFELLAVLVLAACVVFLYRRNVMGIGRFKHKDLTGWPWLDANLILISEITLMAALLVMNAFDAHLQEHASPIISSLISPAQMPSSAHTIERICWWGHIAGVFVFMNYLPYSKHWHIIMSFPNVWFTPLKPKGQFANMDSVTTEVKLMMDPSAQPPEGYEPPTGFGAADVRDLTWKNLMDAYSCTECGRCTSVCPANTTGKLLSPRKIMMSVRDRLETVGNNLDHAKTDEGNLHDLISAEELWACTTCNACAEACPININPVDIIVQMRQYLVMEKSAAPAELNNMFTNLENNGAPWQFSLSDKANWTREN